MAEDVQLIHGEALATLREMPDVSVDAVVTDPPYNLGLDYGETTSDRRPDYRKWCAAWLAELRRVSHGPILISCGIANVGMWHSIQKPTWLLCWWKPASMGRCVVGFNNWEPILLYGRPGAKKGCDVIRACIRPDPALKGHPCPKPLEWAVKQVELFAPLGGTVLDPFAGSFTTGVACILTGRRFVGIELSKEYCEIGRRRIAEALAARQSIAA